MRGAANQAAANVGNSAKEPYLARIRLSWRKEIRMSANSHRDSRRSVLEAAWLLVVSAAVAVAQVGGGLVLSWSSVDGGGGTASTAGTWSLGGTIGQPDAGSASGGTFSVTSGFWAAALVTPAPTSTPTGTFTPSPTS